MVERESRVGRGSVSRGEKSRGRLTVAEGQQELSVNGNVIVAALAVLTLKRVEATCKTIVAWRSPSVGKFGNIYNPAPRGRSARGKFPTPLQRWIGRRHKIYTKLHRVLCIIVGVYTGHKSSTILHMYRKCVLYFVTLFLFDCHHLRRATIFVYVIYSCGLFIPRPLAQPSCGDVFDYSL